MDHKKQSEQLAKAAIRRGVCIQEGQPVVIRAQIEMADAVREIAREAWEAGASNVEVIWSDDGLDRMFYTNSSDESLCNPPKWMIERLEEAARNDAAFISVCGEDPDGLAGVDSNKIMKRSLAMRKSTPEYRKKLENGILAWTVIAVPTLGWARKVYPDLDDEAAMDALWEDVMTVSRANGDVLANWDEHSKDMEAKVKALNDKHYVRFHYTSSNGTDLWVDLPEGIQFEGGSSTLENGLSINCNIPTEELFTSPHRMGVNGQLESVMPLSHNGKLIDGFGFTFKDGKVVDFHADQGYEDLQALLDSDEGSRRLGELALVDKRTPIRQLNRIFYNTLIDENAACHFALGQSYGETLPGFEKLSEEELLEKGMNQSDIHVDFMVGADDLHITGILPDGSEEDVFVNGQFVPSFDRIG